MSDNNRRPPKQDNGLHGYCRAYTPTSYGQYAEGLGTLRASGGDYGGGSEVLILESNQNHATITDGEVCPCLPAAMGLGGAMCR